MKTILLISGLVLSLGVFAGGMDKAGKWHDPLQDPMRPAADKARDAGRKPNEVMDMFGIKSGMRVLEMVAAGGYYTEVLAGRVGQDGEVLAHNNNFMLEVRDGMFNKQITERLANDRLSNVTRFEREFGELKLDEEVDVITLVLNYHDLYSRKPAVRIGLLKEFHAALKPGGVLGIIDAEANPGAHDPALHRIHHERVLSEVTDAGFMLHSEGHFLRNPEDSHELLVFNPEIRGKTDRFVYRFVK